MQSMAGYTKLFNSILASTVWSEPVETRIVWITLLAMADKDGIAEGSVTGLSVFARVPIEATKIALERLSAPDPDSRSREYEGRRIEAVEGGWRILNHAKYRAKLGVDERREYNRVKQAEYRQRMSMTVIHNKQNVHIAEADTEAEAVNTTSLPLGLSAKTWQDFKEHRTAIKAKLTKNAEVRLLKKLARMIEAGEDPEDVVGTSIEQGWRGLFPTRKHGTHQKPDNSAIGRVRRANANKG